MDKNTIKKSVIDSYGKLAKTANSGIISKLFSCCDTTKNANAVGKVIGYSDEDLNAVPQGSNLGVGCGNPSSIAKIKSGDTIVDLGSGAGFDAFIVSPIVGKEGRIIGIDLSEDMIKLAQKNAKKTKFTNTQFIKGDIEQLPLENKIADHIISNCVINLSLNKAVVFKEAYRVLKPGGKLSISDIVLEKELPDFVKHSLAGHIACISGAEKIDTYIQYIKQAGFKNVKIESKSSFPLELVLTDPMIINLAKEIDFNVNSKEAKDIASRVASISISATK